MECTTGVVFVQNTTLDAISAFHDHISNEIPKILEPWSFSLRIYKRNTLFSKLLKEMQKDVEKDGHESSDNNNNMMHTLRVSYEPHKSVSVTNKGKSIVFSTERDEALTNGNCSSGFMDDVDIILQKKFKASWSLFQTIKGEGGNSYEISVNNGAYRRTVENGWKEEGKVLERDINDHDGEDNNDVGDVFVVRSANCFLHGGFKGFLVEVTHFSGDGGISNNGIEKIRWLVREKLKLEKGSWSFSRAEDAEDDKMESLAIQYTEALKF